MKKQSPSSAFATVTIVPATWPTVPTSERVRRISNTTNWAGLPKRAMNCSQTRSACKTSMPTVKQGYITTSSGITSLIRIGLWIRTQSGCWEGWTFIVCAESAEAGWPVGIMGFYSRITFRLISCWNSSDKSLI